MGIDRRNAASWALTTLVVGILVLLFGFTGRAVAEGACPNEALRDAEPYASTLPDCRAYEQVSPVDKGFADALGEPGIVQASPSGNGVTFYSIPPLPGVAGAAGTETYLSTREGGGWATQGLFPRTGTESREFVSGLTEDLSWALVDVIPATGVEEAPGIPAPSEASFYLRNDATGSFGAAVFGEAHFADATPDDSHILFEDRAKLATGATEFEGRGGQTRTEINEKDKHTNLYELDGESGAISLIDVLPGGGGPEVEGAVAGPGGPAGLSLPGGATNEFYTQNTISEDGSRVFFTALKTGRIYAREPDAQPARTVAVSPAEALFQAATPDGRYVFYLESEKLYKVDLNSATPTPEALTTVTSPEVQGTLGVSDDGAYAYFVAMEVLASNETEHENSVTKAKEREKAESNRYNLYGWHNGTIMFIAQLNSEDNHDWGNQVNGTGIKSSSVTPDGKTVVFSSINEITGYDNRPAGGCEGAAYRTVCSEVFLYDAEAAQEPLHCVSCNPATAVAQDAGELEGRAGALTGPAGRSSYPPRNLSNDGDRVFFDTKEALVPGDVNGARNVYEWERSGTGSCGPMSETFSTSTGGCLYLISTGTSGAGAYFGDASANGDDVFFFTYQPLVSQGQDGNSDLYDARVDGGIQAQNPAPAPEPCAGEEACRSATSSPPVFGAPSSVALSGAGNLTPAAPSLPVTVKAKPPTRAQELAKALVQCAKKTSRKKRLACRAQAKRKYGGKVAGYGGKVAGRSSARARRSARRHR